MFIFTVYTADGTLIISLVIKKRIEHNLKYFTSSKLIPRNFYIFTELLEFYPEDHPSHADCQGALVMITRTTENVRQNLEDSENFQLLCELQRDLGGFALLANNSRLFIRQGCLLKHSKRGLQQRIFFLVSVKSIFLVLKKEK